MRWMRPLGLCVALLGSAAGCHNASSSGKVWASRASWTPPSQDQLADASDGAAERLFPALGNVPSPEELQRRFPATNDLAAPRALTAAETIRRAADNSPTAWILLEERDALGKHYHAAPEFAKDDVACAVVMQQNLLEDAAVEARGRSVAAALEGYFSLAQTELNRRILKDGVAQAEKTLAEAAEGIKRGILAPGVADDFETQAFALKKKRIDLERLNAQLNRQLREALQLGPDDDSWRIWPETSLEISVEPLDRAAETASALSGNHELAMLRRLNGGLNSATLPAARAALGAIGPLLGGSTPELPTSCLALCHAALKLGEDGPPKDAADLNQRSRQLQALIYSREQTVRRDVAQALDELGGRARQIALLRSRAQTIEQEAADQEAKRKIGQSDFMKVSAARLEHLQAKSDLVEQIAAWHLARVKLRAVQGKLLTEGLPDPLAPAAGVSIPLPPPMLRGPDGQ